MIFFHIFTIRMKMTTEVFAQSSSAPMKMELSKLMFQWLMPL